MKLLFVIFLAVSCQGAPKSQYFNNNDGTYRFNFDTGVEGGSHSRQESRGVDGTVVGSYSYQDPTGSKRQIAYRADQNGYVATGDVGSVGSSKAQIPVFAQSSVESDFDSSTETSTDKEEQATESPVAIEDEKPEDKKQDEKEGFYFLSLGGKRRLEVASDTGRLDSPPEPKKTAIVYYPILGAGVPYGNHYGRPFFLPPIYHRVPYSPYFSQYGHPIANPFGSSQSW